MFHSLAAPRLSENVGSGQNGIDMAKVFVRISPLNEALRPIAGRAASAFAGGGRTQALQDLEHILAFLPVQGFQQ